MSASVKMRQLESKISDLQTQYQRLLPQRQQDIATLITYLDLASMEDASLVGGLMFVKNKVTTQDPIVEGWQSAGEKFLRRKQKNTLRVFSEKTAPSKAAATFNSTPKLPESHPQSRKEQDAKTTELSS